MSYDKIPRRSKVLEWTPAEKAINDAVQAVETMPADVRLTEAVCLLSQAQNKVADFVDGVNSNGTNDNDVTRTGKLLEIYKLLAQVQGEQIQSLKGYIEHLKD